MKLKLICYLKSGAIVYDETEFTEDATTKDSEDVMVFLKNSINNAIQKERSGTFSVGHTHINLREISAYSLTIEGGECK